MAENKKSVLLYCDIIHTVKELSDEEAGKLFKHYLAYINDLNPTPIDKLTQIVFEPIKQNLKRDLEKWNEKSIKNKEIALASWEKRKNANASSRIKSDAKNTDKVKDKDKDIIFNYKKCSDKELVEELSKFKETYSKDILNSFYRYWSEKDDKGKTKMSLEKTFEVDKRLITWSSNDKKFNKVENKIAEKNIIW
jgi:hypothetical protein